MKKLRLSSTLSLHNTPRTDLYGHLRENLTIMKRHGFDAADMPLNVGVCMRDDFTEYIKTAKAMTQELDMPFEVCHLPYGVKIGGTPEEVAPFNEAVHRGIEGAKLLGVEHAVLHPNTITVPLEKYDAAAEYDAVMEHLTPFAEHAKSIGLSVVVENMRYAPSMEPVRRFCGIPEELCTVADDLGIGVCWDFGHGNLNGLKQSEALAYIGSRLKVLHINDNRGWEDDHLPPFLGTVDWADAMQGLRKTGFTGLLNYEVGRAQVPQGETNEAYVQYLADAAEALMELL